MSRGSIVWAAVAAFAAIVAAGGAAPGAGARKAAAEAKAARVAAQAAQIEIDDLARRMAANADARAALETQAIEAEQRLAGLVRDEAAAKAASTDARAAYEHALIAITRADLGSSAEALEAGRLAAIAAISASATVERAEEGAAALRARRVELAAARADLALAKARLDSARAASEALSLELNIRLAALNADANAAERRAQNARGNARTLRELSRDAVRTPRERPVVSRRQRMRPVRGEVLHRFGETTPSGRQAGVSYLVRPGAEVAAPVSGAVAFAGPFRNYGEVLIIEADGDYAIILTGLSAIRVQAGQAVLAGQPLGRMAADATTAPVLYLEIRRKGRPVDPIRWLTSSG